MHSKRIILASCLLLSTLGSGCVGTGPNTQQGAVAGGALGALAGAIIGNNSRGGNGLAGAAIGAAAGAIAGGTLGNSVDNQRGTLYGGYGRPAGTVTVVRQVPPMPAPPPGAETILPSPSPSAVWIPGFWSYNGGGYVWSAGHWEIPPTNGRSYVAAHWESRGDGYVFVQSYWE